MPAPARLIDAIRQPAFLYGPDGTIAEANDLAGALAGQSIVGMTPTEVFELFSARRPDGVRAPAGELPAVRALAGDEVVDYPLAMTARNGREMRVLVTASPIRDGDRIAGALSIWQDVTGLVAAKEALREGEARFRAILDSAVDGLYRRNLLTDRFEYCSPAMAALVDLPLPVIEDLPASSILDRVHPDDLVRVRAGKMDPSSGMTDGAVDYRLLRGDGTWVWVSDRFVIVRDADGRPIAREGSVRDITERKRAEEALRGSEAKYRTLFDSIDEGFFLIDVIFDENDRPVDLYYVEANAAATRMLGRDWTGTRLTELSPDYEPYWVEIFGEVARTGESVRQERYAAPDERWYDFYVFRIGGPESRRVGNTFLDITERKRAEEASRKNEARLVEAQRLAMVGDWEWDLATDDVVWSRETFAIFGRDPDLSAPGFREDQSRHYTPESWADLNRAVKGAIEAGEPYDLEIEAIREDGERRWIVARGEAVRDAAGAVTKLRGTVQEITERKRIEEELRRAHQHVATLLESISDSFLALDRDWRLTYINQRALGYRHQTPQDVIGRSIWEVFPEILGTPLETFYRTAMESREPLAFENRSTVAIGKTFELHSYPSDAGLSIFGQDITERRRMEDEVAALLETTRRERERLQTLVDSIADEVWFLEAGKGAVLANPAALAGTGLEGAPEFAFDDLLASLEVLNPDGTPRPPGESPMYRALQGEVVTGEELVRHRGTGELRYRQYRSAPVRDTDGSVLGAVAVVRDITEQRRAAAELERNEALLARVLGLSMDGIYRRNLVTGRYEYANPALASITGYSLDELGGMDLDAVIESVHPDDRVFVLEVLETPGSWSGAAEYRYRRRDGAYRWISEHFTVEAGDDGRPQFITGVVRDETPRREDEEALREYAEILRRSNEDLERFAYVSSHDLQEPLRAIVSFSQLLERRYRGRLDSDADEYIDFIVEGGTRMQALIQDLLAYSRVNTTRQQFSPTDTADVLASVERSLDLQLREVRATLTHDPMPVVMADPLQLEQVFANLVSNAIKFRRPEVPLRIHVGARKTDGVWEFSVRDNGIGIEPEYFGKIFVIFQRLHTKDAYPGTGIGLAIVKRIIDRHGGRIRVESTPGEGSTFVFTLPAA